MAIEIADELFDIAYELEEKHLFRFAEHLRGSSMSMSNNIAEGSGSNSDKDFSRYLDTAKKSTFENANILITLHRRELIDDNEKNELLEKLDHFCRKIMSFKKTLK